MKSIKNNMWRRITEVILRTNPMSHYVRKNLRTILASGIVAVGFLVGVQPAVAVDDGLTTTGQICMQKVFGTPVENSNKLNCTANDIRISRAISATPESCIEGETFDLTATFEIIVTANARYDAGFFFRIDGGANARGDGSSASGVCSLSDLTVPAPSGSGSPALNLDTDTCGDLNSGTYQVTFTIPQVSCTGVTDPEDPTKKILKLPNCTSWHSNQGTTCSVTPPTFDNTEAFDFDPDTKSKCVCDDNFTVPVIVETAELTVLKSASPTNIPEPGQTVTYTVQVTNEASFVSVTIDSIIDNGDAADGATVQYGDLGLPGCDEASPPDCNANITENTCDELIGQVLTPGGEGATKSCTFKAPVSGNADDDVTDIVEVCGTQSGNNAEVCGDDDATVHIDDESEVPSLTKTAQSASCTADVTYQVVVSNNSAIDTLTVNSLNDNKFGNITTVHAASAGPPPIEQVVSTTCGQPVALGGAGVLPATIATSDNYTCTFVGRIIDSDCTFTHEDTVTGGVTDDDGVSSTPSDSATVTVTPALQ